MTHPSRLEFDTMLEHFLGKRLPGRPKQYPFEESAIQNYEVGSRMQLPDGTVWHYGEFTTAVPVGKLGRGVVSVVVPETLAVSGAYAVGETVVTITDTDEDHGVNYWQGGKIEIWSTPEVTHRRIIASTASNGTTCTVTLNRPLHNLLTTALGLEICRSPYASLRYATGEGNLAHYMSIYGIPFMGVTIDNFAWIQTWGMTTFETASGSTLGVITQSREVYWYFQGTVMMHENAGHVEGAQIAGFVLPDTVGPSEQTVGMMTMDP